MSPRNGAEQDEFQQFIVRHRPRPAIAEPLTQAFAVVGDVTGHAARFDGRSAHRFVCISGEERQGGIMECALGHARRLRRFGKENPNAGRTEF